MERRGWFFRVQIPFHKWTILILALNIACSGGGKKDSSDGGATDPGTTPTPTNPPSAGPAPLAPVILSPNSYYVSKTNTLVISGSCADGNTVTLSGAASNSVSCTNSAFSFSVTKYTDGTFNLNVTQTDSTAATSPAAAVTWVLDTTAPSAPTITTPGTSSVTSKNNSLTIAGACETGATVALSGADSQTANCVSSAYSFSVSKTSDSNYNFSVTQTDSAGNTSAAGSVSWIRDTVAPSAPTVTSPASNPFTSGDTNLTISGACETGATVAISGSATATTSCSSGTYSFSVSKNTDATYNYSLAQTDPAGNTSSSLSFQWIRNSSIPSTPTITAPATNPFTSKNNTVTISGACTTGDTVTLGGNVVASDVTSPASSLTQSCASSSYSFTVQKTSDNTYNFTVHQTDTSNSQTSADASLSWTRDTVAPSAPVITAPAASPYKSNGSSLILSGSCETGATVNLSGDATGSVTCASSAFSFSVSKSSDATYNFSVAQTDPAGNTSGTASQQWQRSTVAPSAPTITTPAVSSYLSNGNSLTISGACVTGNTVSLAGDGSGTTTCASSAYSFSVSKSSDGTYLFDVTQTDAYGNTSSPRSVSWTRDTLKPGAPLITSPTANPLTSGDNSLVISGTCESGATVNLSGSNTASTTCSSGAFTFTVNQTTNATYNYSITQTDLATNVSAATAFQWVHDNTIPSTPTITSPSSNPYYSKTNTITISGACTANNNVNLGGDVAASDVTTPAGALTLVCPSGGTYSFTVQKTTDGTYTFIVNQDNPTSGNISADASVVWTRDTSVPSTPVVSNPATSPYTASGNLTITGTCESNATVNLSGSATQSVTCSSSSYSFTVSQSVDATYNFSISQTDLAGNTSGSASVQWIRDSSVTGAPVVTTPSTSNYSSNSSSLTISGSCVTGNTIILGGNVTASEVTNPAGSLSQACVSSAFSFVIGKSADGAYSFSLKQNNTSTGDSALVYVNWTRDTVAPDTTITASPTDPNVNLNSIFSFSSADTTASFECQLDSGSYASCVSPVTYASLAPGSHTFNVRARDGVGNIDATPATFTWNQAAYKTIALYHFTSGNVLTDSSLFTGAANNGLTDNGGTSNVTGKFTDGQSFASASSQYLSKADNTSLKSLNTTMSFEAQVKFATLPGSGSYMVLASKNGVSGNFGWEIKLKRQGSNYYLTFLGSSNGTSTTEVKSTSLSMDTSTFHHIAVTWNKGAVKFYYDGVAKSGGTIGVSGSTVLFSSTADFRLGRTETMSSYLYFNGVMDEVRMSQVLRWSSGFTAPSAEYTTVD